MIYNREDHFKVLKIDKREGKRDRQFGEFHCVLNGKNYDTLRGLTNAVVPTMRMKELYDRYYFVEGENLCTVCGTKHDKFDTVVVGYKKHCSSTCFNRSEEHREAVANRFVNEPKKLELALLASKKTRDSRPDHIKKKWGVDRVATLKHNKGDDWYSIKALQQWADCTEEDKQAIVDKANATKKANGSFISDNKWFASCNKRVTIGEREFFCQGYEDVVIQFLYDYGFSENEIKNGKDIPRAPYEGNKCGFHRTDIYIPKLSLMIEVKSDFTFSGTDAIYRNNVDKQIAYENAGFKHIIFAIKTTPLNEYDKMVFKEFLDMTISSQALNEKVQRLSGDTEYRPNAIGSGSARLPKGR